MLSQLIALQIITFIALALLLKMLFSRHLDSALKRLKKLQNETLMRENQLKEELDKAKSDRQAEIDKGKAEARTLVEQAKKEIESMRGGAEEDAKRQEKKVFARGQEELEKLKVKLTQGVEADAMQISMKLIERTFTEKGKDQMQRHFIDELIEDVEKLEKSKFSVKTNKAKIMTSLPLTEKEKDRLKKALCAKMGSDVTITEEKSKGLIMGLIIQLGALEIDGSLSNKLRKALPMIKKDRI
ncbi:MAG: F0F1 ATP synthase subunit delta [Candidatus Omnitrophica bacterium]|nr:F0F1 ATP synthase subunit delta [Candidatus Omnitrophota bacterium]